MPQQNLYQFNNDLTSRVQWKSIYLFGAVTAIIATIGTISDTVLGSVLSGNLSIIPVTAIEWFAQFHSNYWLGLYNLDLLNISISIIMIPTFFALYAAPGGILAIIWRIMFTIKLFKLSAKGNN